jgi:uncharacterized protein (TIRG00374 family)
VKNRKIIIGILVSLFFIYLFIRNIDAHKLYLAMVQAQYLYLIPAVIVLIISFYFRGWRWHTLLADIQDIKTKDLMSPLMIGFMGNSVLPLRLGEFIRSYMLTRREKIPFSQGLATIVLERIFDGLGLILMLVGVLLFFPVNFSIGANELINPQKIKAGGSVLFIGCILLLAILILIRLRVDIFNKIVNAVFGKRFSHLSMKIQDIVAKFAEGLNVLRNWKRLLLCTFQTFLVWFTIAINVYFIQLAFNLGSLPIYAPIVIMVLTAIGVSVPSTPGYVGPYHVACLYAVTILGGDSNLASGFAIVLHLSQMVPVIIIGLYYLWKEELSLKDLMKLK